MSQSQPAGAIHDIGYRHYEGARLPSSYAMRTLAVEGLFGAFGFGRSTKSKIMPLILLAIVCFVAFIIATIAATTNADQLETRPPVLVAQMLPVLALFVASQAPQLISRDLRFRTVSLYFSRPLGRGQYLVAKIAAMVGAVVLFFGVPILVLTAGGLLATVPAETVAADLGRGLLAALVAALVFGSVGLVVAAITPRRGLGVAAIIAVFLVSTGFAGALTALGDEQGHPFLEDYAGLLSPTMIVVNVDSFLTRVLPEGADLPTRSVGLVYCAAAVLLVVVCWAVLLLRYRKVSVT